MKVSEQLKHWSSMANLTSSKQSVLSADQIDEIAEAFRVLEQEAQKNLEGAFAWQQRAEAAESECARLDRESQNLSNQLVSCDRERVEAKTKLSELDKQEPVAWISQSEMALIRPTDKRCVEATLWGVQRFDEAPLYARPATALNVADLAPKGWKLVPVEPTEDMVIQGFESEPKLLFSDPEDWDKYESMSGCQQAAHKARLCWAAMLEAAPTPLQ